MRIATNIPLTIGGQTCILVRDVLGNVPTDKYTSQEQGDLRVWYEESALRETRENNPSTLVYGFWQTLVASGLIDTSQKLQIIYTNDTSDFGYYLYSNADQLHTGTIFDGELQTLPGSAIADGLTIADGVEINAEIQSLLLPEYPLRTHRERLQAAAEKKKSSQQKAFLGLAFLAGIGLLADTGLNYHHETHMKQYAAAQSRLHAAEQNLKLLSRQKLTFQPNQKDSLSNLYQISTLIPESVITGQISFLPYSTANLIISSKRDRRLGLAKLSEMGLSVTRLTSTKTEIKWVNDDIQ